MKKVLLPGSLIFFCVSIFCAHEPARSLSQKDLSRYTCREACLWTTCLLLGATEVVAGVIDSSPKSRLQNVCEEPYVRPALLSILASSSATICWNVYQSCRPDGNDLRVMKSLRNYAIRMYGSLSISTAALAFLMCNSTARYTTLVVGGIFSMAADTATPYVRLRSLASLRQIHLGTDTVYGAAQT